MKLIVMIIVIIQVYASSDSNTGMVQYSFLCTLLGAAAPPLITPHAHFAHRISSM